MIFVNPFLANVLRQMRLHLPFPKNKTKKMYI
jgi:hypothetical protein